MRVLRIPRQYGALLLILLPLWAVVLTDARDAVQPQVPWLDEKISLRRAARMADGEFFDAEGGWMQPPGYPAILALTSAVALPQSGVFETAPFVRGWQLAQIAAWFGVAACLLASGRRMLGHRWGWIPVMLFVLHADGWILALRPLPEIWLALASAFVLWMTLRGEGSSRSFLWMGLVAGVASLLRGHAFLLIVPAMLPVLGRRAWRGLGVLLLGTALPIAVTSLVHSVEQGELVGPSSNAGINLYVGNRAEANGLYNLDERYDFVRDPAGREWLRELGRDGSGSLAALDGEWRALALEELRERPAAVVGLCFRKLWLQMAALEIPQIDGIDAWRRFVPTLHLFLVPFGLLSALTLLSALWWKESDSLRAVALGLLLLIAAQSLFFVAGRFRLIFLPHLCLLGAFALLHGLRMIKTRRGIVLLPAAAFCTLAVVPWGLGGIRGAVERGVTANLGIRWSQLVAVRFAASNEAEAFRQLERWGASDAGPAFDERSGLLYAKLLSEHERHDEAQRRADALQERYPDSSRVAHARALSYIRGGKMQEANAMLQSASERWPQDSRIQDLWQRVRADIDG